ncbi:VIR protein [Plasmodium vivax]|uniref:VIR protein n=1 Tax=Plasmodium vivax TaxID=5855 RepID=A0A1G4E326_PLAVI|nr:VIR protein [Plasmodium vivax]
MPYKSYLESSYLKRLIRRLDDAKNENCYKANLVDFGSVEGTHKQTLKNIGCSLEWGYSYLTVHGDKTLTDLCTYLNLWLDVQNSIYENDKSNVNEEDWQIVEKLWNDLYVHHGSSKCIRQKDSHNISDKEKHMELLEYCMYRDHIKEKCENAIKYTGYIQPFCPVLSEYTDKYYNKFKSENICLENSGKDKHYKYYVSEECNLYDMPQTFPEYDSVKKQILNKKNSRKPIDNCTNTTKSDSPVAEEKSAKSEENRVRDEENAAGAEDKDVRSELDGDQDRLVGDRADLTQLVPQSPTDDLNVEDPMITTSDGDANEAIMPPKVGTVGATLAGSSIFLLMMYKYTPLGSWVNTKILRKDKLMENMRKNNYELLLNDLGDRDVSLNDTMYHIRYNSSSNQ